MDIVLKLCSLTQRRRITSFTVDLTTGGLVYYDVYSLPRFKGWYSLVSIRTRYVSKGRLSSLYIKLTKKINK